MHSKRKLLYFVENVEKPGRFFMQKAAAKILKPLDKYNQGGGIMNPNRGLPYARKEEKASGERPLKQCGGF